MSASPMAKDDMENSTFFTEILDCGIDLRVRVTGRSMAPAIRSGEIVVVKKIPVVSLRIGDLILFKNNAGALMLHRILFKRCINDSTIVLRTKGDALKSLDGPIQQSEVLGRVYKIQRKGPAGEWKTIDLDSLKWRRLNELIALKNLLVALFYFASARIWKISSLGTTCPR